jgi:hypothetical protein
MLAHESANAQYCETVEGARYGVHVMPRARRVALLLAVSLMVGSCGSSNTVDEESSDAPTSTSATDIASSIVPAGVSTPVLADALAATRRIAAGRYDLRRTSTLTTGDSVSLRYQGDFDRTSMRLTSLQTFEGSKRLLDALAAASNSGATIDMNKMRIHTLRDDKVVYVGPSPDGADPTIWFKYDQAAFDRLSPDSAVVLGELLVMMIDSVAFTKGAKVETLPRVNVNGKAVDTYRTTVEGVSVVAELGNSAIRSLKVAELLDRITTEVPAVVSVDSGRVVRLSLDLTSLYAELVKLSGNPSADTALKSTKSVVSEFTLTETVAAGSITFTVPDPAKVRVS